jgi:hypothetical protein
MEYFHKQSKPVTAMFGGWGEIHNGQQNVNWLTYQEGLKKGLTPEQAALLTPTGKAASRYGMTDVRVEEVKQSSKWEEEGGVGAYFSKPAKT